MTDPSTTPLSAAPRSLDDLEEALSRPTSDLLEQLRPLEGDILVLGAGGKMGPTLARMAHRARTAGTKPEEKSGKVIAVSRFSSPQAQNTLQQWGVETIAGDLSDEDFVQSLPNAPNIVYMVGFKFGASSAPATTWGMNCYPPALVCRRFPESRIVAFSTGNVYGLSPVKQGGSREEDPPRPVGEYAMAALGRERMFQFFSDPDHDPAGQSTSGGRNAKVAVLRLNYAVELRYGVLVDLGRQILSEQPIDLSMGYVNLIWQGDANAMALAALAHVSTPPTILNVSGLETLSIRELALQLGRRLEKEVRFDGEEASDALLSNGRRGADILGGPQTSIDKVIQWTADWLREGGDTLEKPTHFQEREGVY